MALVGTRSGSGRQHVMAGVGERGVGVVPAAHHNAILAAAQPGYYAHLDPRGSAPPQGGTPVGAIHAHQTHHRNSSSSSQQQAPPQPGGGSAGGAGGQQQQPHHGQTPTPAPTNSQEVTPDRPIGYGAFGVVW
ncbi:serine/threonine-protein kinase NLK-like [Penaeus japonicus]|uniref:serine/threonine-protein kinase NLK-like n=1 Tax=Penaeus japonicus TaxID=27405 RepID=UPI001C70FCE1|nr:serine/threonine-protein kinase NLK-like [Penaeus japonicus]